MKRIIPFIIILFAFEIVLSQTPRTPQQPTAADSLWIRAGSIGLNINQASFSENWQGGGTNNIALGSVAKGKANYKSLDKTQSWDNQLLLEYGVQKSTSVSSEWRKTVDQIFLDSKYGYRISDDWNAMGGINFRSQFAPGYEFGEDANGDPTKKQISEFMSPGYLTEAAGVEYKPDDYFFARFGIGTLRQTFVLDTSLYINTPNQKNYGVEIGKTLRNEFALQLDMGYTRDIAENVNLQSRYVMFANYETINEVNTIDHRLDAILTMKVNSWLNVTLSGTFIYDEDMIAQRQWSQAMNIGFLYTL
ncbi:MAG: DUF3078 domain-containing protein [Candidatus Kapaibacteriales bacterium]